MQYMFSSPIQLLSHILFILNFLIFDNTGLSASQRLWGKKDISGHPQVMWKDVQTGQWKGPDPVLIWGRGFACVFPTDAEQPIWVPDRLVRHAQEKEREPQPPGSSNEENVSPDSE